MLCSACKNDDLVNREFKSLHYVCEKCRKVAHYDEFLNSPTESQRILDEVAKLREEIKEQCKEGYEK